MRLDYGRIVHYVYHHHLRIILLATLLSAATGYFAVQLPIKTDFADLLPKDYASVRELNRIKERVGGIGPLMVIVTAEDLGKAAQFMEVLADSLERNPLITSVSRHKDQEFFSRNRLLYMERQDLEEIHRRLQDYVEQQKLEQSPLYFSLEGEEEAPLDFSDLEAKYRSRYQAEGLERDYYLTAEKNGVILRLYPAGVVTDLKFNRNLLASIDRAIAAIGPSRFHPSIECTYQGSFKNTSDLYDIVTQDLFSSILYSVVGVLLVITLHFRQVLASLFIAFPLVMGMSWTFGLTYLAIGYLNQITVGLFAVLFGLGIDHGIHIFARYREARRRGLEIEQALAESIQHTGNALTISAVTTALAFYALAVTEFKGFSEFGLIAGTGFLFSLVAMLVICPAFIVVAERLHLIRLRQKEVPAHLLRRGRYPLPWATLAAAALLSAYALYHLKDLEFEYDFYKLQPALPPPKATLPEELQETRSPAVVLTETPAEAQEVVEAVEQLKAARGDSSTVASVYSIYSFLPKEQPEKLQVIARIRHLLDEEASRFTAEQRARADSLRPYLEVRELGVKDLPEGLTKMFTSKGGQILDFVVINASVQLRDGRNAIRFADEVKEIHTPSGKTFYASSAHIIFAEMLQVMLRDGRITFALVLGIITALMLIDLRRLTHTLVVLAPLLVGMVWVAGVMYFFGISLNLYNMIAFPTVIGMGIDYNVHIFHRYREEGKSSLRLVLRTTGVAQIATSLTTMVGYAGLIPAQHPALYSLGLLSMIGIGFCFLTSMTLLPALLQVGEKREPAPPVGDPQRAAIAPGR